MISKREEERGAREGDWWPPKEYTASALDLAKHAVRRIKRQIANAQADLEQAEAEVRRLEGRGYVAPLDKLYDNDGRDCLA